MKRFFLSLFITSFSFLAFSENILRDWIILRNGDEIQVDIYELSMSSIRYFTIGPDGNNVFLDIPLEEVYMLTKPRLGDVFVSSKGSLIFGKEMPETKGADWIYFTEGIKLRAKITAITLEKVSFGFYYKDFNSVLTATEPYPELHNLIAQAGPAGTVTVDKNKVFMVKQNGGMRLVLSPLAPVVRETAEVADSLDEDKSPATDIPENAEQVIFHMVERGQTLDVIAQRYGVTPQNIIEWNDLPKKTRKNQVLSEDSQLIIYVKPIDSRN